jgi:hypothetical protein
MPDINLGRGAEGLPPGGQMQREVEALSDPGRRMAQIEATRKAAELENTQRNLRATFKGDDGSGIQSLKARIADHLLNTSRQKELKNLDPETDHDEYMLALNEQIKKMEKGIKDAQSVNHIGASNTYAQVLAILKERKRAILDKDIGMAQAATQPTTQPVEGQ